MPPKPTSRRSPRASPRPKRNSPRPSPRDSSGKGSPRGQKRKASPRGLFQKLICDMYMLRVDQIISFAIDFSLVKKASREKC